MYFFIALFNLTPLKYDSFLLLVLSVNLVVLRLFYSRHVEYEFFYSIKIVAYQNVLLLRYSKNVIMYNYRFLLVDDHNIVYQGLKLAMAGQINLATFDNCYTGDECLEILKDHSYDLIILDVNLPETDTQNLLGLILHKNPDQKVLIFSMSPEEIYAKRFLKLGAIGFLSKDAKPEEVILAIQTVLKGKRYISLKTAQLMSEDMLNKRSENAFDKLTEREIELLKHMMKGKNGKEISELLHLHQSTVGTHKVNIYNKLGVQNFVELTELAKANGFVP